MRVYSSRPDGIGWGAGSEMPSVHLRTAVGRAGRQPAPAPLSTSGRARCCSGSFCHLGRIFPLEQEHDCRGPVTCHTLGLAEGPVVVSEASRSPRRRQDSVWISAAAPAHLAEQTPVECLTGLVARSGLLPVLLLRSSTSASARALSLLELRARLAAPPSWAGGGGGWP